jgi:hypothetical protein
LSDCSDTKQDNSERRFTLFPRLPIELHFKIWRYVQPGLRFIHLCCDDEYPYDIYSDDDIDPALLDACKEAPAFRGWNFVAIDDDTFVNLNIDIIQPTGRPLNRRKTVFA